MCVYYGGGVCFVVVVDSVFIVVVMGYECVFIVVVECVCLLCCW